MKTRVDGTRVYWIGLDRWRGEVVAGGLAESRVVPAEVDGKGGYAVVRGPASSVSWDNKRQRKLEVHQ